MATKEFWQVSVKKAIAAFSALLMLLSCASCGREENEAANWKAEKDSASGEKNPWTWISSIKSPGKKHPPELSSEDLVSDDSPYIVPDHPSEGIVYDLSELPAFGQRAIIDTVADKTMLLVSSEGSVTIVPDDEKSSGDMAKDYQLFSFCFPENLTDTAAKRALLKCCAEALLQESVLTVDICPYMFFKGFSVASSERAKNVTVSEEEGKLLLIMQLTPIPSDWRYQQPVFFSLRFWDKDTFGENEDKQLLACVGGWYLPEDPE